MAISLSKKNQNRSVILECIFRNAPISRVEISDLTKITPATVTANITELINEGIVYETGDTSGDNNSSGRKRILIDIVPDKAFSIGVEFTQRALIVCLTNLKGTIISSNIIPFENLSLDIITEEIISEIHKVLNTSKIQLESIIGIGIAVPGHMNKTNSKLITNNKIWDSFNPAIIRSEFPFPVIIENNVHCMTLGQYLFHPKNSPSNFIYFHVSYGMFCSHITNGRIYYKDNFMLGEIGHTIVDISGPHCECGKHGCLQTYASESWLVKNARILFENSSKTYLKSLVDKSSEIKINDILTAYSMGDPFISNYISNAIKYLGASISNLSIILGTQKIYLHGILFNNDLFKKELLDFINQQLLFVDTEYNCNIEILHLNTTDGAVGASALSILNFFINEYPFAGL